MSGFARVENSGSEVGAERGLSIRWVRRKSDHGPRYTIPHTQHPSETALTHALSSSEHARPGQEQTEADQGAFRGRPIHAYAGQSRFRWACQHELADGALPWQTSAAGRGPPSSATAVSDQSRRTLLRREDFRDQAGSRCSHSELNVPPVRRSRHTVRRAVSASGIEPILLRTCESTMVAAGAGIGVLQGTPVGTRPTKRVRAL